ncbi:putative TPR repeat-containing protein [Acidobacteriia bacterium SbA2]|nr:putative TPR repeat-containing protein [Acidobacteriia bacterium SbA2]
MLSSWRRRLFAVAGTLAAMALAVSAFAQTGGLTGKCLGEDGKPLAGYTILVERQEMKWSQHTKTNKKGEYVYIGLSPASYKITLLDPSGKQVFFQTQHVGIGDPTEVNFDMAKERANTMKENPEAVKKVEEAQKDQKQFTGLKATFDQATALFQAKQYADSAAMFEKALPLAKDKNVPIVLSQMAQAYSKAADVEQNRDQRSQDQQKAVDTYQKALALSPNDPGLHNNLGSLYANMNKVDDAKAEFQKAADLNPSQAGNYYYNLGVVMVNQGKMDDASVALKKATDLDPNNANAFYWYGMALLGKAETKPDGSVVPVPGTIEAFQTYLKLQPSGQWAQAAQASIDQLKATVPTEYKKTPKKKG